jgi:hypothetical protein
MSVWRQALVDRAKSVTLFGKSWPVRHTAKRGLCQIDFDFEGEPIRGLEQNLQTASRWALMARKGARIMQFLSAGRYLANVADGKVTLYSRPATDRPRARPKTARAAK